MPRPVLPRLMPGVAGRPPGMAAGTEPRAPRRWLAVVAGPATYGRASSRRGGCGSLSTPPTPVLLMGGARPPAARASGPGGRVPRPHEQYWRGRGGLAAAAARGCWLGRVSPPSPTSQPRGPRPGYPAVAALAAAGPASHQACPPAGVPRASAHGPAVASRYASTGHGRPAAGPCPVLRVVAGYGPATGAGQASSTGRRPGCGLAGCTGRLACHHGRHARPGGLAGRAVWQPAVAVASRYSPVCRPAGWPGHPGCRLRGGTAARHTQHRAGPASCRPQPCTCVGQRGYGQPHPAARPPPQAGGLWLASRGTLGGPLATVVRAGGRQLAGPQPCTTGR